MERLREICKSSQFEQEMAVIEPNVERADEYLEGIEIVLARLPECGTRLGNTSVWFIPGWTIDLAIYYTFDDERVVLLSICKTQLES